MTSDKPIVSSVRVMPRRPLPAALKLWLAAEILAECVCVKWRLSRVDLRTLTEGARERERRRRTGCVLSPGEEEVIAVRLAQATTRTLRILPKEPKCLVQSLVVSALLSARGIRSTLVIGVRSDPEFSAHAWVEREGRALLPRRDFQNSRLLEI